MGVDEFRKLLAEQAPEWHFDYRFFPSETHYSTAMPALLAGLESLTPGYFTDVGPLLQLGDYEAVLAHFEAKKALWSGFHFDWLQAYTLGKYLYYSEQKSKMAEVLALAKKQFPEDLAELSAGFAKVLNNRGEFKLAKELLLMTSRAGATQADWQQQLSLALVAEGDSLGAKAAHAKRWSWPKPINWKAGSGGNCSNRPGAPRLPGLYHSYYWQQRRNQAIC